MPDLPSPGSAYSGYGDGYSFTNTTPYQGGAGNAAGLDSSIFQALLMKKLKEREEDRQRMLAAQTAAAHPLTGQDPLEAAVRRSNAERQIRENEEASRPAPMTYTPGGFNNPSHLEMDTAHMTANQRQLFLPKQSTENPEQQAKANKDKAQTEDDEFERYKKFVAQSREAEKTGGASISGTPSKDKGKGKDDGGGGG